MNGLACLLVALGHALAQHWQAEGAGAGVLAVAAVTQMPPEPPGFLAHVFSPPMWTWIRDTLQTAVPAARMHRDQVPVQVPAANPPTPNPAP